MRATQDGALALTASVSHAVNLLPSLEAQVVDLFVGAND
jgi:hypothetical protein